MKKEIKLTQQPYIEESNINHDRDDNRIWFCAQAEDADGVIYHVRWLSYDTSEMANPDDWSDICDWENPDNIEATEWPDINICTPFGTAFFETDSYNRFQKYITKPKYWSFRGSFVSDDGDTFVVIQNEEYGTLYATEGKLPRKASEYVIRWPD